MTGPTERQLEELKNRIESYRAQRRTFEKIPSSVFSVLGVSGDEIMCRYSFASVSEHYVCGGCNITSCSVKQKDLSHS